MSTNASPTAELLEKSRRRRTSPRILAALAVAGALAVGGLAFAAGRMTAPAAAALPGGGQGPGGFQGPGGQGPGAGAFGGGGGLGLEGTITSMDVDSLTLETANGSTITVNLSGDTTYAREENASSDELAEGDQVRIGIDIGAGGNAGNDEVDANSVTITQP